MKKFLAAGVAALLMINFSAEALAMEKPKAVKVVQTAGRDRLGDFAPEFARYNDDILFGEVWSRNDILSLHDRSIVTICALVGSGILDSSLKFHIVNAKKTGVTRDEMVELVTQIGFYAGWPKAWAVFPMAKEVYGDDPKGSIEREPEPYPQNAGRKVLGDFAPEFARYNDDILFGEVWSRNNILSLHDRSIVTVSTLVGAGIFTDALKHHLAAAKANGVTKEEMVEIITQLGFYAGWPKAWAVFPMAKEIYQ
mgnify:CR=1 FL=1